MSWWSRPELTSGVRPALTEGELELVVQNNVGLYDGYVHKMLFSRNILYENPKMTRPTDILL